MRSTVWKNENIDISDHQMISITCKTSCCNKKKKDTNGVWREIWNIKKGNWTKYCEEVKETLENDEEWIDTSTDQIEK